VLRVMPMPADANGNGDIFGGWIMAQVDLAGAVLPARIAKGRIVTVAVNEFVFALMFVALSVRANNAMSSPPRSKARRLFWSMQQPLTIPAMSSDMRITMCG